MTPSPPSSPRSDFTVSVRPKRVVWCTAVGSASVAGIIVFPSGVVKLALCALAAGLVGAMLLNSERRRSASLLVASIAVSTLGLAAFGNWLAPSASNGKPTRTAVPAGWIEPDPVLGYRLAPSTTVMMTASIEDRILYRVMYTISADGSRLTPAAPEGADSFVFLGDSFVFGEGLADRDTLPAQFAQATHFKVATANLAVPGYGPNHLVRTLETRRLASFQARRVQAVVTWIIPSHLDRVIGEAPWLDNAPAYALDSRGRPHFGGSFSEPHPWQPLDTATRWLRQRVEFLKLLGQQERQMQSADLFVALMVRLKEQVKQEFDARLIVLYSWPDGQPGGAGADPLLVRTLERLRQQDVELLSVNELIVGLNPKEVTIPHDGHPTATVARLTAHALKRRLFPDLPDK